jgi:hypothetical protein
MDLRFACRDASDYISWSIGHSENYVFGHAAGIKRIAEGIAQSRPYVRESPAGGGD